MVINLLRADRTGNTGHGGVALYIKTSLRYKIIQVQNSLEHVMIEIQQTRSSPFIITALYHPPDSDVQFFDSLEHLIDCAAANNRESILLGDINIDMLTNNNLSHKLNTVMTRYQHSLHVHEPTRVTPHSSTLIDHIWSTDSQHIHQACVVSSGISDHHLVLIVRRHTNITQHQKQKHAQVSYKSYKRFNSETYLHDLEQTDWSNIYNVTDPEKAWNNFVQIFNNVTDKHAPLKQQRVKIHSTPWINDDVLESIRKRDFLHRIFLKTKDEQYHEQYKKMRNYTVNLIQRTKAQFFETTVEENKFNPKALWKQIKLVLPSSKSTLPNQIKRDNKILHNPNEIANEFNQFFSTVAEKLTKDLPLYEKENIQRKVSNDTRFTIPPISKEYVIKQINSMPNGKATGLDGISVKLLKIAKIKVADHIAHILNMSITNGCVPSMLKEA